MTLDVADGLYVREIVAIIAYAREVSGNNLAVAFISVTGALGLLLHDIEAAGQGEIADLALTRLRKVLAQIRAVPR